MNAIIQFLDLSFSVIGTIVLKVTHLFRFKNLVLRASSEREGSAVAWFLNGVLKWWSGGVLCKIPSSTGEQEFLRIAMDKSSFQHHNLC